MTQTALSSASRRGYGAAVPGKRRLLTAKEEGRTSGPEVVETTVPEKAELTPRGLGELCADNSQCTSGYCADGRFCAPQDGAGRAGDFATTITIAPQVPASARAITLELSRASAVIGSGGQKQIAGPARRKEARE